MNTTTAREAGGPDLPRLLTVEDVMAQLRVSRRTVSTLRASGRLRPTRIGRSVRYSSEEVARFIAAHQADV